MRERLCSVAVGLIIALGVGTPSGAGDGPAAGPTQGGLAFRLGRVVCLSFSLDAATPLHEARLVVDGKVIKSIVFGQGTGVSGPIKLAVITPVLKEQLMQVYFGADQTVEYMSAQYATENNASGRQIFYGAGSNLTLHGWTTVYQYSERRQKERHEATVEAR